MSDPKRATLITVGATNSEKTKVNKTVRLTINLVESNESKYPELNYKELVIAEECKKRDIVENGKTDGLHPFSDNDDDVERVARKFEQKYGGKSTYGRKGRSKHDDFADIGAGYDENDSFIDNTDGYDEMIPPECDTLYGGFYINCGSLEFKNVDRSHSDDDIKGRRNKRRLSSSSSEEESSDSSSSSDAKRPAARSDSHLTEPRKKKNKKIDKKPKKIRRTDSSAATSGKQTSDDNNHGDGESADSRTSQSDSLTSKPAPSSENAITSDSSRDVDAKMEVKLPPQVVSVLEELETTVSLHLMEKPGAPGRDLEVKAEGFVIRLDRMLSKSSVSTAAARAAWARAARAARTDTETLLRRVRSLAPPVPRPAAPPPASTSAPQPPTAGSPPPPPVSNKRKPAELLDDLDVTTLSEEERETKIVETLQRLKALIEERKPGMMANYNAECERVQEERKKIQIASAADGAPHIEKRLPKRRFPWCPRTRALLARLVRLAHNQESAATLLAKRALPLFPSGFVRMPTLLRQADLSKEIKVQEVKRQRLGSNSQPPQTLPQPLPPIQFSDPVQFPDPIQFPSSLTVTTMKTSPDKNEMAVITDDTDKHKSNSIFGSIINSFSLSKDLVVEKQDERKKDSSEKKEELYIPPNNIGSITITPVPSSQPKEKKVNNVAMVDKQKDALIRVKSPAALNEMVNKQEKVKALENIHKRDVSEIVNKQEKVKALENIHKRDTNEMGNKQEKVKALENIHKRDMSELVNKQEKVKALENIHKRDKDKHKKEKVPNHRENRVDSPLHIDTNLPSKAKEPTPSPKTKDEVSKKQIETMRIAENNIPRPGLVPVHHSPTFAKPDKRPPEIKKKKDLLIISDVDPLGDVQMEPEPVSVDDSSSDVELVEDSKSDCVSDSVPSKDKVSVRENHKDSKDSEKRTDKLDDATKEEFDSVMKNLRDLEQHSQDTPKFNSSSYGGVITSAKREKSSSQFNSQTAIFGDNRSDKDKLTSFFEQNGWM